MWLPWLEVYSLKLRSHQSLTVNNRLKLFNNRWRQFRWMAWHRPEFKCRLCCHCRQCNHQLFRSQRRSWCHRRQVERLRRLINRTTTVKVYATNNFPFRSNLKFKLSFFALFLGGECLHADCRSSSSSSSNARPPSSDYPNLMPSALESIYQRITDLRRIADALEKAVQDASAAVRPPTFNPVNNIGFPISIPYNPPIYN